MPPPLLLAALRSAFGWTLPTYQCLIQRSPALFDNLKISQRCRRQPLSNLLPRPALWCYGVGVRVSLHVRRGAPPYADGCSQIIVVFTLNLPVILR